MPDYHTSAERPRLTRSGYLVQRLLETIPGVLVWAMLAMPAVLFFISPSVAGYALFAYMAYWMARYLDMISRQLIEFLRMRRYRRIDWRGRLMRLEDPYLSILMLAKKRGLFDKSRSDREEKAALRSYALGHAGEPGPGEVNHLVILATYNESAEILEQSLDAILAADYPMDRLFVCMTVEERSGVWTEELLERFRDRYEDAFGLFMAVVHPDGLPGEGQVKGANLTWAARHAREELHHLGIEDEQVIVSAFDADTRAGRDYFSVLAYKYLTNQGRDVDSYQPVLMFHNNIWDVPMVSRLVGFCSTFWTMMESARPSRLRLFSSHAIGMKALVSAGYWSVVVIPDDSRQFWRMFFASDGQSRTVPLHTPLYLDAVLSRSYFATLKEQYLQLRRWAYGVIDFPYIMENNFLDTKIPLRSKTLQTFRQISQFNSWATVPFMLTIVPQFLFRIEQTLRQDTFTGTLAVVGLNLLWLMPIGFVVSVFVSLSILPPRPAHRSPYKRVRFAFEWLALPLVLPIFICLPAVDAQTRLIFRRYLGFRVTAKRRLSEAHKVH